MSRRREPFNTQELFDQLTSTGDGAPSLPDRLLLVESTRRSIPDGNLRVDEFFIGQLLRLRGAIVEAEAMHEKLSGLLDQMTTTPWHPARFVSGVETPMGRRALVLHAHALQVLDYHDDVDPDVLGTGDAIYLSSEKNLVIAKADETFPTTGDTAAFERATDDGRIVLRHRDDELIVQCGVRLDPVALQPGQQILVDRAAMIALEAVAGSTGQRYLIGQVEDVPLDRVGGQAAALHELLSALTARLTDPGVAATYGLTGKRAVMLTGSPGCGKTLLARVCAAEIQRRTGKTCRFAVVKPGEWLSAWVGETEKNIRACFEAMREASRDGLVVLFIDEIESIGRIRGRSIAQHDDRFLTTLLAELDGFSDRGEVAVIAATNRKDLLDPALVDRLCDVDIVVPRPDMRSAREIFAVHLANSLRYYANGVPAEETREQMIDRGVSRLYGPNADNEVCSLHFRDGKSRTVAARELVSGRMIEQICRGACSHAFERHITGGSEGLRGADIDHAVDAAIERLRTTLSAHNARAYLEDLPQDIDVVRVEPIAHAAKSAYRYLHA